MNNQNTPLYPDTSLEDPSKDELGYKGFSKNLAETIENISSDEPFVVGIYGRWGSGKSTVLNFTKHYLKDSEEGADAPPKVIEFNPWWFSGQEDLIQRFLSEMESGLEEEKDDGRDFEEVREKISGYALKMSKLPISNLTGLPAEDFLKLVGEEMQPPDKTLQEIKEEIGNELKSMNSRVVIMLDDVDRLTSEEIRQMFRLIKSVADFPNVTYVLAFDQEVVVEALEDVQGISGEEYLDKIIQLPKHLPIPKEEALDILFEQRLREIKGVEEDATLFEDPEINKDRLKNVYQEGISPSIETPRDVVRLSNSIATTYSALEENVNFIDLVGIETIRVFNRNLYEEIRNNPSEFTRGSVVNLGKAMMRKFSDDEEKGYHERLLSGEVDGVKEPSENEKKLLKRLFPRISKEVDELPVGWSGTDEDWDTAIRRYRIGHSDNFSRYFRQTVPEGQVSNGEIRMLLDVEEGQEFADILREISEDSQSKGKTKDTIKRLAEHTEEIEGNQAILEGVLLIGDELIRQDDSTETLHSGIKNNLTDLVENVFPSNLSESELDIEQSVRDGRSIYLPAYIFYNWLHTGISPEGKEIVIGLSDAFVEKVEKKAEEGTLRDAPDLSRILIMWGERSDSKFRREWADEVTDSNSELLRFVNHFKQRHEFSPHIVLEYLDNFVDINSVETRIREMDEEALTDEERKIREVFLRTLRWKEEDKYPESADYSDIDVFVEEEE